MINHARTLLLNARKPEGEDAPWERHMPAFNTLELPSHLEAVRQALVGKGGWWDKTYRVEMLLTVLDSPKYAGKFDWMDARTTPPLVLPFVYAEPDVSVTRVALPTPDLYVTYLPTLVERTLPIKRTWDVIATGSERFTITYLSRGWDTNARYDAGMSAWVLPVADDFSLVFSGLPADGDRWSVRAYRKPQNLFAIYPAVVNSLSAAWTAPMFTYTEPTDEPVKEYARWFKECVHAEDRVAAVILAYLLKATKVLNNIG